MDCYGSLSDDLLNKLRVDCIRPKMAKEIGFERVES